MAPQYGTALCSNMSVRKTGLQQLGSNRKSERRLAKELPVKQQQTLVQVHVGKNKTKPNSTPKKKKKKKRERPL